MGVFNNLRKRAFTATITSAKAINNFTFNGRPDIPKQAAIVLGLKTSSGKETQQQYPCGDAKGFKVINDGDSLRPVGDASIGETTGGGYFLSALIHKCNVDIDDSLSVLEGLTFKWAQEAIPGRKSTILLPFEQLGGSSEEEADEEESEESTEESAEESEEEEESDDESDDESDESEDDEEDDEEESDDVPTLTQKTIVALLKSKKRIPVGRVNVLVHKALAGQSPKVRLSASKLAGTSKFLKDKGRPWTIKNDNLVGA